MKKYAGSQVRKLFRNSPVEFLLVTTRVDETNREAVYEDETIWLSQRLTAELFGVDVRTVNEHLRNVFASGELDEEATIRNFRIAQSEGQREVSRAVTHYNLDAIMSVGYRVNSVHATQFRQWATSVLRNFAIRGYVLDRERMEGGTFVGEDYFEHLLEEIHEIRLSERGFYQRVSDVYATSVDYNRRAPITTQLYSALQTKMHGPKRTNEATELNALLDLAESRARRQIPMTMEDWASRLDAFLQLDDRELLDNAGSVSREQTDEHAKSEFEKYRIVQDRRYVSDFDRFQRSVLEDGEDADE